MKRGTNKKTREGDKVNRTAKFILILFTAVLVSRTDNSLNYWDGGKKKSWNSPQTQGAEHVRSTKKVTLTPRGQSHMQRTGWIGEDGEEQLGAWERVWSV